MFMQCLKDPRIAPSTESAIDGVPIPVDFRHCPPRRAFFSEPKHCGEEAFTGFWGTHIDVGISLETIL